MKREGFWMVWNENGGMPRVKHATCAAAVAEAERLARSNRGETFIVLKSYCARVTNDLQRIDMEPEAAEFEELPF
jgi:hypothetical protein